MIRQSRKMEHLKYSMLLEDGPAAAGFADFSLIHNCLPELNSEQIDISTTLVGIKLNIPVIINAITGGAEDVLEVNRLLAEFAGMTGAAIAVGSQFAAIEKPEAAESFKIVRKLNPQGVVFANLGAYASPDAAKKAVDMIEAQAIQIHLNAGQEMIMNEGDRDFRGYLANIEAIVRQVEVPVIVKEVGCGIAAEQAGALESVGIKAIDVGGTGGTNFLAIEAARSSKRLDSEMLEWGIPTAISATEVLSAVSPNTDVVVSGGVRTSLDVVKALAIGGAAVGIAGPILRMLSQEGLDESVKWFNNYLTDIKRYMLLVGAGNTCQLKKVPVVITGYSREWLDARGLSMGTYARRKNSI